MFAFALEWWTEYQKMVTRSAQYCRLCRELSWFAVDLAARLSQRELLRRIGSRHRQRHEEDMEGLSTRCRGLHATFGLQLSTFNYADKASGGVQIGVINIISPIINGADFPTTGTGMVLLIVSKNVIPRADSVAFSLKM